MMVEPIYWKHSLSFLCVHLSLNCIFHLLWQMEKISTPWNVESEFIIGETIEFGSVNVCGNLPHISRPDFKVTAHKDLFLL